MGHSGPVPGPWGFPGAGSAPGHAAPVPCPPQAVGAGLQHIHATHTPWSRNPPRTVPVTQTSTQHLHAPRDSSNHLKTQLFQPRKSSFQTLSVSVFNYYHLFGKLSHCYNKIRRSKSLLAQPFLIPETMPIFFHHIRSCVVGEGQECEETGKCNLRRGKCVKI